MKDKEAYGLLKGLPEKKVAPFLAQFIDDYGDTQYFYLHSCKHYSSDNFVKEDDDRFVKIAPQELVKW